MDAYHFPKGFANICGYILAQPASVNKHVFACFLGERGRVTKIGHISLIVLICSNIPTYTKLITPKHKNHTQHKPICLEWLRDVEGTLQDPLDIGVKPWFPVKFPGNCAPLSTRTWQLCAAASASAVVETMPLACWSMGVRWGSQGCKFQKFLENGPFIDGLPGFTCLKW